MMRSYQVTIFSLFAQLLSLTNLDRIVVNNAVT